MFRESLEVRGVSKRFGPVVALNKVDLTLTPGRCLGVIGENGAGKSTLMNIICGNLLPTEGEILLNGDPVDLVNPATARRNGIVITPQEIQLVPHLTVAENIMLGRPITRAGIVDKKATREAALAALIEIEPRIDVDQRVREITVAQQQLVQIARATATGARVLIFDEPSASLTTSETARLFAFMARFKASGGAMLYISHRLEEITQNCDDVMVLRDGEWVGNLDPSSASVDEMIRLMVGRETVVTDLRSEIPTDPMAESALEVDGLTRRGEFEEVSFTLNKGEVLAIGGLIGSGRSELARCIFADTKANSGEVRFFGNPVDWNKPADAIKAGLIYLPEERKQDGIFPQLDVGENIALPSYDRYLGFAGIKFGKTRQLSQDFANKLRVKTPGISQIISNLSGGNQQKVLICRWLFRGCKVLILDEPTRGIDVNAKLEIQKLLRELTRDGLSIIYISSELQEIIDVSERVIMMHEGRVKGEVRTEKTNQESLLALAMK